MSEIKAIQTYYNGFLFRSRLEARWAVFFDKMGIQYEYEPEGLILSDGSFYLPDFFLIPFDCYFEVKRKGIDNTPEGEKAIWKIRNGAYTDSWAGIIAFGDPVDHNMTLFCQEFDDSGGGSYESKVVIGLYPDTNKPMIFAWGDTRWRTFISSFNGKKMPVETDYKYRYLSNNPFISQKVISAELAARQERFEDNRKFSNYVAQKGWEDVPLR